MSITKTALVVAACGFAALGSAPVGAARPASLGSGVTTLHFKPGWDDLTQPLNWAKSTVTIDARTRRALTITYALTGAVPGTALQIGIEVFQSPCTMTKLGQYGLYCGGGTRQGVTATLAEVLLPAPTVGTAGTFQRVVKLKGVAPGTYRFEFTVRDAPNPTVIYQAPGPFAKTAAVTVRA